ncbi:hypothetical protein C900_03908 [Fulvivirga imtechensis AK7]|uniref:Uncharacterized protein n=1 Tax=Fulvivirga imtechensis AK7 TaxID=1237149 RepID=L8JPV1_9BACT|nr:hypothetical protein C900_03908 [Fulvivirga imtechensis AK7]
MITFYNIYYTICVIPCNLLFANINMKAPDLCNLLIKAWSFGMNYLLPFEKTGVFSVNTYSHAEKLLPCYF